MTPKNWYSYSVQLKDWHKILFSVKSIFQNVKKWRFWWPLKIKKKMLKKQKMYFFSFGVLGGDWLQKLNIYYQLKLCQKASKTKPCCYFCYIVKPLFTDHLGRFFKQNLPRGFILDVFWHNFRIHTFLYHTIFLIFEKNLYF